VARSINTSTKLTQNEQYVQMTKHVIKHLKLPSSNNEEAHIDERFEVPRNVYTLEMSEDEKYISSIGSGAFGIVLHCKTNNGNNVAIKKFVHVSKCLAHCLSTLREIRVLKALTIHNDIGATNILTMLDLYTSSKTDLEWDRNKSAINTSFAFSTIYMVTPKMDINLYQFIKMCFNTGKTNLNVADFTDENGDRVNLLRDMKRTKNLIKQLIQGVNNNNNN